VQRRPALQPPAARTYSRADLHCALRMWTSKKRPRQNGASQFSNATPRESPSRQIMRHLRTVRKLSKDNSKFGGRTGKSSVRMPAPTFVISVTQHDRTPICPLKNSNAPLSILVLAVDLRSFIAITRALNELLIPIGAHPPDILENSDEWWSVLPPAIGRERSRAVVKRRRPLISQISRTMPQPLRQLCRLRRMRSSWMTVVKGIPLVPNSAAR